MNEVIELNNLTKKYSVQQSNAVDHVSFDVKEGEFFTLLGPNGAGKTTIISILTTTLSKTSGDIKIFGLDLEKNSANIRSQLGIIFQKPSLDLNLTAEENIRFHAILYGLYSFRPMYSLMPKVYKEKVNVLSDLLDIRKEIFKPVRTFSGGMKRKLEIIRSLMHEPGILFLDEPTTGLDPQSRKHLWEYLIEVQEQKNTTIFLTTHYLEEAEKSNRVCIINKGKIIEIGSPQEIKGKLTEEYLLIDTADEVHLLIELANKNIKYYKDNKQFKLPLNHQQIHELIKSIDTPLTNITIHQPTLGEAYIEIIKEDKENEE